jgi:hypothetical protein
MSKIRRISDTIYSGDGKRILREEKEDKNTRNSSVIYSGDGKRILREDRE